MEFPRRARVAPQPEAAAPVLPAWRVELNEKVRAIRAKRNASSSQTDIVREECRTSYEAEAGTTLTVAAYDEEPIRYPRNTAQRIAQAHAEPMTQPAASATSVRRSSTNIVEAALTRVKRASENASRAALPKIEPARSIQAPVSLGVDRQATARALAPAPEIEPSTEPMPIANPAPELVRSPIPKPTPIETHPEERLLAAAVATPEPELPLPSHAKSVSRISSSPMFDDLEPLDYLEAEIRKVDKALGAEFLKNESPSILTHAVIGVVDLMAIALSCSPFLAIVSISEGSFSNTRTGLATGGIVFLISFFYLALTQGLCGRTFGMMLTNTRVVDELTFEPPSASRSLLRTAGYFIAAMPAMIGIIWAAFNRKHRGWQDFLSGTIVVRDF